MFKGLRSNLKIYECNMRRKCNFSVLHCDTSLFERSVINMGIRLYNKMPNKIKWKGFWNFKQILKLFLLNHTFLFIK